MNPVTLHRTLPVPTHLTKKPALSLICCRPGVSPVQDLAMTQNPHASCSTAREQRKPQQACVYLQVLSFMIISNSLDPISESKMIALVLLRASMLGAVPCLDDARDADAGPAIHQERRQDVARRMHDSPRIDAAHLRRKGLTSSCHYLSGFGH